MPEEELTKAEIKALDLQIKNAKLVLKKSQAELKKKYSEVEKANTKLVSLNQKIARIKRQDSIRDAYRAWLPNPGEEWANASPAPIIDVIDGFNAYNSIDIKQRVLICLEAPKANHVYDSLAGLFDVESHLICLVEQRRSKRKGVSVDVLMFRYTYSLEINDVLKVFLSAHYDGRMKAWSVVFNSDEERLVIIRTIARAFGVVVDLNNSVVYVDCCLPVRELTKHLYVDGGSAFN